MTMTTKTQHRALTWLGASALALALAACGAGQTSGSAVTGLALSDAPVSGTVTITDSSATVQTRTVSTRADGSFSVDVADLTPPFMLRVADEGSTRLYAVTEGNDTLDINPITDMAFSAASEGSDEDTVFRTSSREEKRTVSSRATALLVQLKTVLAPLFQLYGITDPATDQAAVRRLLADVRVTRDDGIVTVTNRATGGVIFTGPLRNLASGTFTAANMPAGPGTGGGTADGAALYAANCQSCHGALATSQVRGESASSIREAIADNEGGMGALSGLTTTQISAIAAALSGSTGGGTGGGTCTSFTYSAWGTCTNGSQTRTVLTSSPSGCTGGAPVTTQTCSAGTLDGMALYNQYCSGCHGTSKLGSSASSISSAISSNRGGMGSAALRALTSAQIAAIAAAGTSTPATCTGFTYSAWGTCTNGSQTRTVIASSPTGCTGGNPVTSQACTSTPATCTSFTYSAWGTCTNGSQTRTVLTSSPSGCAGGAPVTSQACTAAIDGAALYTQYCSGCHGNSKKGSSASSISSAISSNRGGMGSTALRALTAEQIAAIAAAP